MTAFQGPAFDPIVYSEDEILAMRGVKAELLKRGVAEETIGLRALAVTTINSKLRIVEAADKYTQWVEAVGKFNIPCLDDDLWKADAVELLRSYAPCGLDKEGRSIFWIKGGLIQKEEEENAIKAGIMYFMAIHADNVSLHNGISFVIDVANQPSKKIGNEQKMQNTWQAFPLRPQRIFISGAGMMKRVLINGLLKVASFFTKQKILDRIRFATLDEVLSEIPLASTPDYIGGKGGDVKDLSAWVKTRLDGFTVPAL